LQVNITFDPNDVPKLTQTKTNTSDTTTTKTASPPASTQTKTSMHKPFDYKAELERLSIEIETKLHKHFDDFFAQLESKINNLIKQNKEQAQININVMKQLGFLVENMKNLTKHVTPILTLNTPSPQGEGWS